MNKNVKVVSKKFGGVIKEVVHGKLMKTYIPAGLAGPSPPLGPMIGQRNLNISEFCKEFNQRTSHIREGVPLPTSTIVNPDRTYKLTINTPPTSYLIKMAAGCQRGAMNVGKEISGIISLKHVYEIARLKMTDRINQLNTMEEMCISVIRTAKSVGVQVSVDVTKEEMKRVIDEKKRLDEEQLTELLEKKQAKVMRTVIT
ncbi:hypothetical protein SNEBB_001465 [Seison nebaliae]|nr:hypothetical protein SNEBB_001465 [Seison nebaliae]